MYADYIRDKESNKYKSSSTYYPTFSWPSSTWRPPSSGIHIPTIRIGGGGGGFRRLKEIEETYGDSYVTSYINEKLKEPKNIDKTFRIISDKISAGYYLGFQDVDSMNK